MKNVNQVKDEVGDQVWNQVYSPPLGSIWNQVREGIKAGIISSEGLDEDQVGYRVRDQVGDQVRQQVRDKS